MHVAVVGAGVTGLSAAWELVRSGAQVSVLEASPSLGGKVVTEAFRGRSVDLGPDSFLARVPHALELCHELGLGAELVHPAVEGAGVWLGGRLRPLPAGVVLGAPTALVPLARSGILSPSGVARAALDLVLPRTRLGPDPTVAEIVTGRLGRQVQERLVDPLVGGVHAGPSERLSARATAPQLADAAARRSLVLSLRARRAAAGPVFASLRGGLARLVDRLGEELRGAGARVETGVEVDEVPVPGADATVVATPAVVAARLVTARAPDAAADLAAVDHASVALVVLAYPAGAFPRPPATTGFLVPRSEGQLLTACSFGSAKWPHWAAEGEVVLRASAGRWGDERALALGDDELVARLHAELTRALGLCSEPLEFRVARWPRSFPQYRPGHLERVARVEQELDRRLPGVVLAGAAYRGVGLAACIGQGRAAAHRALAR